MAKGPIKKKRSPIFTMLKFLLLLALISAAGLDWYILYLMNQGEPDWARIRKFAGITGGFTFTLVTLILILFVLLMMSGAGAMMFRKGLGSKSGILSILFYLMVWGVAGINFAIMPTAKELAKNPENEETLLRAKRLAIAGAGMGTGLLVMFILFQSLKIYTKKKKTSSVMSQLALK